MIEQRVPTLGRGHTKSSRAVAGRLGCRMTQVSVHIKSSRAVAGRLGCRMTQVSVHIKNSRAVAGRLGCRMTQVSVYIKSSRAVADRRGCRMTQISVYIKSSRAVAGRLARLQDDAGQCQCYRNHQFKIPYNLTTRKILLTKSLSNKMNCSPH